VLGLLRCSERGVHEVSTTILPVIAWSGVPEANHSPYRGAMQALRERTLCHQQKLRSLVKQFGFGSKADVRPAACPLRAKD
jgi:hypothetical protein